MSKELDDDFKAFCKINNLTISEAIRMAIKLYIGSKHSSKLPIYVISRESRLKGQKKLEELRAK
jgi:hypothetical protein